MQSKHLHIPDPADLSVEAIYQQVKRTGLDWADKKAAYLALEDVTATIRSRAMKDSTSGSVAGQRVDAEASTVYKTHLTEVAIARRDYLRAEVLWKSVQLLADLRRTEAATERAKMRIL